MAAGDAVQLGTAWKIGFGAHSYTGYMPEDISTQLISKLTAIPDERGATVTKIYQDPGKQLSGTWLIKDTGGSLTAPAPGATVTLTPPEGTSTAYCVVSAVVRSTRLVAQLVMTLVKEDAMTYT